MKIILTIFAVALGLIQAEEPAWSLEVGHWTLAEALGGQGLGGSPRRPWEGTQATAFGQGCRTGLESGAHPGSARRALECARNGQ